MPLRRFSVTIPVHNGAAFLSSTLESVLAQDPGPERMQIVVVDDCSTDHPEEVVQTCGGDRIEFIRAESPLGPARAFNRCVESARGELIHLLHADDLVLPGFYERVEDVFSKLPQVGLFVCRAYEIDIRGRRTSILSIPPLFRSRCIAHFYHLLVPVNWIRTPGVVVPRAAYEQCGTYDERLNHTQDWNMWLRIATKFPVWYDDDVLTEYRVHPSSDTNAKLKNGKYLAEFFLAIEHWLTDSGVDGKDLYLQKIADHVMKLAMEDLHRNSLAADRIELLGGIFKAHIPGLLPRFQSDADRALRHHRRQKRRDFWKHMFQENHR
jgi:glycosyltransferase involved in cell wall biosynthesis